MHNSKFTRRNVLKGTTALAATTVFASRSAPRRRRPRRSPRR